MIRAWDAWVARASATESATALALFRVAIGTGALLAVGATWLAGLVPVLWVDARWGGLRPLGSGPWLVALLGGPRPEVVSAVLAVALLASAAVTLGIGGRVSALAALVACTALTDLNPDAGGSYDLLLSNGLWLLVLAGGHQTLSVGARARTGRWWPRVEVWSAPRWLAAWQLALMYTATGLQKIGAEWVPGGSADALFLVLQQVEWLRRPLPWLGELHPLTQVATTVTWCWEVLAPVGLLAAWFAQDPRRPGAVRAGFRKLRVRAIYVTLGVTMHALLLWTVNIGPFGWLSLAYYVTLASPDEWERWLGRAP